MYIKQLLNNRYLIFWVFFLSLCFALIFERLIQEGMFQDAMLYSCVSHNLSIGIGTFWFPQYSTLNVAGLSSFHEHPPLIFGIQSLFYKVLGDSTYTEKFYTLLMFISTSYLIHLFWKEIYKGNIKFQKLSFIPLICWIIIPSCFWSYRNNMQENTMGLFNLVTVFICYKTLKQSHNTANTNGKTNNKIDYKKYIFIYAIAGLFIFFATLGKGIPGFAPLAVPFLYWLCTREIKFSTMFWVSAILAIVPLIAYFILFNIPESRESLTNYLFKRVFNRVNAMPTVDNHAHIIGKLFMELLPSIILAAIIVAFTKYKKLPVQITNLDKTAFFLIGVGFAASLPIALTLVQKAFYLVPAFPYMGLGIAMFIAPTTVYLIEKIDTLSRNYRIALAINIAILCCTITYTVLQKDKFSREEPTMHDVYEIGKVVPKFSTITIPIAMWDEYNFILQGFLVRYFNISISPYQKYDFYLLEKTMTTTDIPTEYQKIEIKTQKYDLYKRK